MRIIISLLLVLTACNSRVESSKKPFFDIESFINNEINSLTQSQIKLRKHYIFNGIEQDTILEDINWEKELEAFRININKPAWINEAIIDSNSVLFAPFAIEYQFNNDKIPFGNIVVVFKDSSYKIPKSILINYRTTNFLYTAGKELEYDSDNGYKIVGVQEVNGLEDVKYRIEAKFNK